MTRFPRATQIMCVPLFSKPQTPALPPVTKPDVPAPPPAPEKSPEAPNPDAIKDRAARRSRRNQTQGVSSLRIPLNVPGYGAGLNI